MYPIGTLEGLVTDKKLNLKSSCQHHLLLLPVTAPQLTLIWYAYL